MSAPSSSSTTAAPTNCKSLSEPCPGSGCGCGVSLSSNHIIFTSQSSYGAQYIIWNGGSSPSRLLSSSIQFIQFHSSEWQSQTRAWGLIQTPLPARPPPAPNNPTSSSQAKRVKRKFEVKTKIMVQNHKKKSSFLTIGGAFERRD